jgi:hypothetical protein
VLFNWVHPSEVTEAYHKRRTDSDAEELRQVREGYMGRDAVGGKRAREVQSAYV